VNAADLARLEIAKRAYTAAQPNATEVQTGVRRARLSLRRVMSRRTWFGKGLVLVVLAVGSLAYAKPHALGELVENLSHTGGAGSVKRGGNGVSVASPAASPVTTSSSKAAAAAVATAPSLDAPPQAIEPALHEPPEPAPRAVSATTPSAASKRTSEVAASAVKSSASSAHVAASPVSAAAGQGSQAPPSSAAVSDWGRVAQALASGDETKALSALSELSESDDQRTRDKADLGRAQLFMAHGDSDKGCALVRSLSNRRAGSHIERQAQLLLKSCTR
jgi:hypothetical protein